MYLGGCPYTSNPGSPQKCTSETRVPVELASNYPRSNYLQALSRFHPQMPAVLCGRWIFGFPIPVISGNRGVSTPKLSVHHPGVAEEPASSFHPSAVHPVSSGREQESSFHPSEARLA